MDFPGAVEGLFGLLPALNQNQRIGQNLLDVVFIKSALVDLLQPCDRRGQILPGRDIEPSAFRSDDERLDQRQILGQDADKDIHIHRIGIQAGKEAQQFHLPDIRRIEGRLAHHTGHILL